MRAGFQAPVIATTLGADGILLVTLDRPERRNAMVPEMMRALALAFESVEAIPAVRAVVLTGAAPAFSVGADVKWLGAAEDPGAAVAELVGTHHAAVRAIQRCPVPVVAAVNGAAAGGGMSLALATDYRVASLSATFTAAYFGLGLPPDGGNSAFLVRTVGAARAMELVLTNCTVPADQALALGLVSRVVPRGSLQQHALAIAAEMAGRAVPPDTLRVTRRLLDEAHSRPLSETLDAEEAAMCAAAAQPAFREALRRFLDRPRE